MYAIRSYYASRRLATGGLFYLLGWVVVAAAAGIPLAGGHSIDSPAPIFGLVAIGTVDPVLVLRNSGGREGDQLILTKRLGIGIVITSYSIHYTKLYETSGLITVKSSGLLMNLQRPYNDI